MKLRLSALPLRNVSHKNCYCSFHLVYLLEIFFFIQEKNQSEALKCVKTTCQYQILEEERLLSTAERHLL